MILVGIDVAKDKHDCFIQTLEGKVLHRAFTITNNQEGFDELYSKIQSCNDGQIRVGLEATGHYSYNILGFLLSKGLPSAKDIAKSRFSSLANLLEVASNGRIDREKAKEIRNLARKSVGVYIAAKAMELRQTIELIQVLDSNIVEIEEQIQELILDSPITSIPGIGFKMAAMIQAEVGDFKRFSSPDKILAFAGLSPSTYQSGKFFSSNAKMDKRGSRYLRHALFISAQYVSLWCPVFKAYYQKKRAEGKHYFVALSHVAKKLIRVIYHLQKSGELFQNFA